MKESYTLKQELTFAEFLSSTIYISIRMKIIKRVFFFGVGISILNGILNTLLAAKPPENWYKPAIQFIMVPVFMICFFGVVTTIICAIVFICKFR